MASILATLRREGVPASFFLTGDFVRRFATSARSIAAGPTVLGNHTATHPDFVRDGLSAEQKAAQVRAGGRGDPRGDRSDDRPLRPLPLRLAHTR